MRYKKHTQGPYQKTEEEAKILSEDEYFKLSELLRQFTGNMSRLNLLDKIEELYIERFPLDSKVTIYFENWSKVSLQSDSYMSLIFTLDKMCQLAYQKKYFRNMM